MSGTRWPELTDRATLLVPVGSCEQHGPHLPLDTDTRIAAAVAQGVDGALLAQPVSYGASGEHQEFPGTVSIGTAALRLLLVELGRSAAEWAGRIVFVNGHGGNLAALTEATGLLRYEGRDVGWFPCVATGSDAHAGAAETALMLAIAPEDVREDRAVPGNTAPLAELLPSLRAGALRTVSPTGVLGDPTLATAAEGVALLGDLRSRLRVAIARWEPDHTGRLG